VTQKKPSEGAKKRHRLRQKPRKGSTIKTKKNPGETRDTRPTLTDRRNEIRGKKANS